MGSLATLSGGRRRYNKLFPKYACISTRVLSTGMRGPSLCPPSTTELGVSVEEWG